MNNNKPKMINQLHLIYPLIIAAISMISLATFYYGGGSKAGEMVSFASTLSSIILSVIAIIMTIVDVAGQRNTVADLKETAEQLDKNLTKVNYGIQEINDLKDELLGSMGNIMNSNTEVLDQIVELKQKYIKSDKENASQVDEKYEEFIKDLDKLNNKIESVSFNRPLLLKAFRERESQSRIELRVHCIKKEEVTDDNEVFDWVRDLALSINRIYNDASVGFGNMTFVGNEFNFRMSFTDFGPKRVLDVKNFIESIDGEKFKVSKVTFRE
ncbi:hypothetical protein [Cytobacillus firmus]|uniref:hypothetical protein n=1 Tax=Cytobacillus firmus TaxID=1399 RepID=UPI001CFDB799|nr:hypothetical protein [Cytobacillus firmus]